LLVAGALVAGCGEAEPPAATPAPRLADTFDARFKALLEQVTATAGERIITYERISDRVLTRKVTIDSDYYMLGYQTGLMARAIGISPGRRTDASRSINERIVAMYREIDPPFLEKSRGVAAAFDLTLDDLDLRSLEREFYVNLYWVLFNYEEFQRGGFASLDTGQCSILSHRGPRGEHSYVGRNFDYGYNVPRFFLISNLSGVYRTIGNTGWAWNHWIMDGINERGLFIGVATNEDPAEYATLGHQPYPDEPAVNAHHMMSIVLDRCADVEEALALIGRMRIWFADECVHFLLADAAGRSVVVEFDLEGRLVPFRSEGAYQVVTNTALQIGQEAVAARCWRFDLAESTLASTPIRALPGLLEVNRSIRARGTHSRTLWISMADLTHREMDVRFLEEDHLVPHVFRIE